MNNKIIRRIITSTVCLLALAAGTQQAHAQFYELANQLPGLLQPALSGSMNYKGYFDLSGTAGLGNNAVNFLGASTSQGFQYSSWFFMGVGLGVDVAMAQKNDNGRWDGNSVVEPDYYYHSSSTTKVMLPVFTDFRFNIGPANGTSAFLDIKIGATWLLGGSFLALKDGTCLGGGTQFYLKPTLGVRVPVNSNNPRQAFNFGVTYQLITSNNNYSWNSSSVTLNSLGATVAFEW